MTLRSTLRAAPLLSLICAAACSRDFNRGAAVVRDSAGVSIVESTQPARTEGWRVDDSAAVHIPSGVGETAAERPVSVTADRRGRVLVADGGAGTEGTVLVYEEDGRFLFRAGAESGSQALTQLTWAAPYLADSIVAFDRQARRLVLFAPDGAFAREISIPFWRPQGPYGLPNYAATAAGPMTDGSFLTSPAGVVQLPDSIPGPGWFRHDLLRLAPDGVTWDTLGAFEVFRTWVGENAIEPYPFGAVAFEVPHPAGFVASSGETFEIRAYDREGALRRIIRRAYSPAPVNEADLAAFKAWYLERAKASPQMDEKAESVLVEQLANVHSAARRPAISNLLVDYDGNMWAEEFRWVDAAELAPDPRPATWSVFDPEGRWLTQLEMPAGFLVSSVSQDRVYGVAVDAEGRRAVVAYPLIKP